MYSLNVHAYWECLGSIKIVCNSLYVNYLIYPVNLFDKEANVLSRKKKFAFEVVLSGVSLYEIGGWETVECVIQIYTVPPTVDFNIQGFIHS